MEIRKWLENLKKEKKRKKLVAQETIAKKWSSEIIVIKQKHNLLRIFRHRLNQ